MAVISSVTILNEALMFLGEAPLLAFPEESANSDKCEPFYERVKGSELEKFPWNFALFRAQLTRDETNPLYEYDYQYVLPPSLLRVRSVYPRGYRWKIENTTSGKRLLTDLDEVYIQYIKLVDESQFTHTFATVVSARMAIVLAETLTERPEKAQQAAQWYADALREAKRVDSQESSVDEMEDLDVINVRSAGTDSYLYRDVNFA